MKKLCLLLLVACMAAVQTSCRRAVEKAVDKIRVEAIESVALQGFTGAEVVVRIDNGSGYKLQLDEAALDLYLGGSRAGRIVLREPLEVPRRTALSLTTRWQLKIDDPLALYALTRNVRRNDLSQIAVSLHAVGRGGPAPVNISREKMPLSEFLNIFGIGADDLGKYLKK